MNYELYRRSTLGECLTDALDELIRSAQMTPQLAMKVLLQFDKSMTETLNEAVRSRATLKVCLFKREKDEKDEGERTSRKSIREAVAS